eukprot:Gregarina_sp_Pseudo_9__405@NODE_1265_length_1731_cov_34_382979_g746_i1_p1_GENE_NODE_1265_length_1731_cov_34_382979_g746_i1NODE_1265_length_1731_cov_34_382979_g746_i1_p1_ORF_typecomplete_len359_score38_44DAGAT/PF03982_13/2_7e43COX1/PF00115_20/0_04_NODE_1265_length_1731_cov_34_382979_g746_i1351078
MSIQKEGEPAASAQREGVKKYSVACVLRAVDAFKGVSPIGIAFYKALGLVICTAFACSYYLTPLFTGFLPFWILFSRFSALSLTTACIWIGLAVMPIRKNHYPDSRFYTSVALYFDAELHFEQPRQEYTDHHKPIIFLCYPHGTISYGGWSLGALSCLRPFVSAVVDILCVMPVLRQFFTGFNICSGSRRNLKKQLTKHKRDVVLYPGGMAELFLSDPDKEQLYFNNRKGCIKLALETGSDIVVVYLFGNTQVYRLWGSALCTKVSRFLRSSITIFWGRFGLIPHKTRLVAVTGEVIELPDFSSNPNEITSEVLDKQHGRVKSDIQRVYDSYRHLHPQYANKPLTIF